jgi:uncharacterized membrane protein
MNNDLIVMTFDNELDALKAKGALEIIRNRQFLGVANAVPVTKDRAGKVVVHLKKSLPVDETDPDSQIPGQIVNIFFDESEYKVQELVAAGLDASFRQMVNTALEPGSSLILIYIHDDSLVDTQQVLEAIKQFNGTLYHTTITPQLEEVILKQGDKWTKV